MLTLCVAANAYCVARAHAGRREIIQPKAISFTAYFAFLGIDETAYSWPLQAESFVFLVGASRAVSCGMHGIEKRTVYILRSVAEPQRHYVGITNDLDARLEWHNKGPSGHTVPYRPWRLVVSLEFPSEKAARSFERDLKSGSGRAFAKRHFGESPDDFENAHPIERSTHEGNSQRGNTPEPEGADSRGDDLTVTAAAAACISSRRTRAARP